jgi:nonsense-mediated mRNA decay protein 3
MCLTCITAQNNISQGITKEAVINQCRNCRRYQRPPWVYAERESKELLALCLRKIRGLKDVKLVDAGFLYTEPHSRRIKVKLTISKEINKGVSVQETFVVEFTEHFQQCEDCQKEFTPHTWGAVVQLRQHAKHKKTLLYLEQVILKHNVHDKCVKVQEEEHGIDFFFKNRQHAQGLVEFLESMICIQLKQSK